VKVSYCPHDQRSENRRADIKANKLDALTRIRLQILTNNHLAYQDDGKNPERNPALTHHSPNSHLDPQLSNPTSGQRKRNHRSTPAPKHDHKKEKNKAAKQVKWRATAYRKRSENPVKEIGSSCGCMFHVLHTPRWDRGTSLPTSPAALALALALALSLSDPGPACAQCTVERRSGREPPSGPK
jgi:hypothetical protein